MNTTSKKWLVIILLISIITLNYADESASAPDEIINKVLKDKEIRKAELKEMLLELLTSDKKSNKKQEPKKPKIFVFDNRPFKKAKKKSITKTIKTTIPVQKLITINKDIEYPYKPIIKKNAILANIDSALIRAIIKQESNNNKMATSPKDAKGLMQLIDPTAKRFGVSDSYNPSQNIKGGVKYLKVLLAEFKDIRLVLASYNAGEGAVRRWGGIPPYPETQNYVRQVMKFYRIFKAEETEQKIITENKVITKQVKETVNIIDTNQRQKSDLMIKIKN